MKSNLIKKLLAACLCLTIFLSTPMHSYAAEGEATVSPRFTYILEYSMSLTAENGNAHIVADLISKDSSVEAYIKCNLEKLTGSTYWMQMKSFSSTGTGRTTLIADHAIDRGTYRVMGTFRCHTETQTAYTGNQTY